jgi:pilus assembly protein CpaE
MSEAENQANDILLPGASVAVFSEDQETLAAAGVFASDWRFARVSVDIHKGNVETAIKTFQQQGYSSNLVIIQTDEINDHFTERLAELSQYCDEGTSAIIIGPVNDVYLYRRLIEMGISDYLVRPVKPEILTHLVAKILISKLGVSGSRLISFIGAKGGVGTSTFAQAAAFGISELLDEKTILLDAGGGWSSLSVGMGFDPAATLAQMARTVESKNEETLKRMLFRANENLTVVAGGSDGMLDGSLSGEQYERMLDQLMVKFPVVLVDLSCAENTLRRAVLARSNQIVLVTVPTVTSLRFARALIKEISDIRGGDKGDVTLVVNQQGLSKAHEVPNRDIEDALEFKVSAVLPHMPALFMGSETDSRKIITDREGSSLLKNTILPLFKQILSGGPKEDDNSKKSGILGGFLTKGKSK